MYSHFKGLLPASELLLNFKKSAFTCSDPKAATALKKILGPNDPKVCGVVKDLGVDNSGARRRRVKQSRARLDKASARNSKLQKLAVPTRKIVVRVNRFGVQTTATWGHKAQGCEKCRAHAQRSFSLEPKPKFGLVSSLQSCGKLQLSNSILQHC